VKRTAPLAVFAVALLVRVVPGWLSGALDYDEGVYLSAAAVVWRGAVFWRDFVFLHPPGIALLLAPLTAWGTAKGLMFGRALVAVLGALSVVMMYRSFRGWAGVAAALFLGLWWETVITDRGVFLEPLMNFAGLAALTVVRGPPQTPRTIAAGALCGLAVAFKVWALVWCLAVLIACCKTQRVALVGSAVATFAGLVLPWAVRDGSGFLFQVFLVHAHRPPDGDLEWWTRVHEMFISRSLDASILTVLVLPWAVRHPIGRPALVGVVLMVAAFLRAPAFWNQYDAALAPWVVLVLGAGLEGILARPLDARVRWLVIATVLVCGLTHVRKALERPPPRPPPMAEASEGPICAFENRDLVLDDLLPAQVTPLLIDSYGQALADIARSGRRFESMSLAFQDDVSQTTLRAQLRQCAVVRPGERAQQMNAATRSWLDHHFQSSAAGLYTRRQ
jgi:hypothetical protein